MSRPPYVLWFCKDWIADTLGLTHFQEACYHRLIMAARTQSEDWCSLPDDDAFLAVVVRASTNGWRSCRPKLIPRFWKTRDGRLIHPRLEEEATIQRQRSGNAALAGKASVEARATKAQLGLNGRSTSVQPEYQPEHQRNLNLDVDVDVDVDVSEATPPVGPPLEARRRRPPPGEPDREIPDDFRQAMVERFKLTREQVDDLAERLLLEFDARGYKDARSALINWCRIEASAPAVNGHAHGTSRQVNPSDWPPPSQCKSGRRPPGYVRAPISDRWVTPEKRVEMEACARSEGRSLFNEP